MGFEIIHQISIAERMDPSTIDAFEEFMRNEYFPAVFKGPTRVGQVTGLALLRGVEETHERTNTFLMQVSFDGLASGGARVDDEEIQRKFDSFGARLERLGAYATVAVWSEEAET
jgi:hypothetical protein